MRIRSTVGLRTGQVLALLGLAVAAAARPPHSGAAETALDRYVAKPDPAYSWEVAREVEKDGMKQIVVRLRSQSWRTTQDVDRVVWEHWLVVARPERPLSKTAFLFIGGGRNRDEPPGGADELTLRVARETGTVAAELRNVPNQPLAFGGDGKGRSEDDLIAYTWDRFLVTGDETWPARLPMVKSAVRAMDCVQEISRGERGWGAPIEGFVVAGGSKRGWTTWCTAAVDKRVVAAIPIVIDVLNVTESMEHHAAAYGFYSLAVGDYLHHRIMQRMHHPRTKLLYEIEDPYSYRDRLTMPKLVLNASGDEFFCPDSSQFYWDGLKGEKLLRYVQNSGHSLKGSDAADTIIAFYDTVLRGAARPRYSWTFPAEGSIRVKAEDVPREVQLWQATNPEARDFRFLAVGKLYSQKPLTASSDGVYVAKVDRPAKGWTAFFVELTFDVGGKTPLKLSTPVRVVPETLPHAGIDPVTAPLEERPDARR
ncbi:MAG: PhoPQ-activated pathogenicity-related family protein [Planctomycetes bacterium]|nr:PhoPQ-activated pathogenicity-related family protein [Planctomycetota bacterium]